MKYFLTFLSIVIVITIYSCDRCMGFDEANESYNATFYIAKDNTVLYDLETQAYLCDSIGQYCLDSVILYDVNLNKLPLSYGKYSDCGTYYFSFIPIYNKTTDKLAIEQEISKMFYLRLNYIDTDTIEIKYSLKKGKVFCNDHLISDLQAFYNGVKATVNSDGQMGQIIFQK